MWFKCLVQRVMIVYCAGVLLAHLSSDLLVILLDFELSSFLGFTFFSSSNDNLKVQTIYVFSARSWT